LWAKELSILQILILFFKVVFRLVIFRPFEGEILLGEICEVSEYGLKITLGFFEDIVIPKEELNSNSKFLADRECWAWTPDPLVDVSLYITKKQEIRFRVLSLVFGEIPNERPAKKVVLNPTQPGGGALAPPKDTKEKSKTIIPMQIIGSIATNGLGPVKWW